MNYLPSQISSFSRLKEIDLSNNNIPILTDELFKLPSLNIINLANNKLQNLPDGIGNMSNLMNLNLSNNNITNLPTSFSNLKMKTFNIDGNNLSPQAMQILNIMNGESTVIPEMDEPIKLVKKYKAKNERIRKKKKSGRK